MPRRDEGFREYCGAKDPNRVRSSAACVLSKGHRVDIPHKDLDGARWLDEPAPANAEPKPAGKRTRLTPNRLTGWKPELVVEIELVERDTANGHSLYAVYLAGEMVGWVSGYRKYSRGQAGWAYSVGAEREQFGYHAGESRRAMVERVVEEALKR